MAGQRSHSGAPADKEPHYAADIESAAAEAAAEAPEEASFEFGVEPPPPPQDSGEPPAEGFACDTAAREGGDQPWEAEEPRPAGAGEVPAANQRPARGWGAAAGPQRPTEKGRAAQSKEATISAAVDAMMAALGAARAAPGADGAGSVSGGGGPEAIADMMVAFSRQQALSELGAPGARLFGEALSEARQEAAPDRGPLRRRMDVHWPTSWSDATSDA
eukprot:CAMPEP_0177579744 /NCGR_PEP_ID=MMETSP0419_2-20121207/1138_1 /TAXON_ID=582737 /ORGANISM="Tetraselmis sp., Strain GSL018" /LENGTH=217 /DNA_ID=CAMNT_0019068461 /DNA_START=319 /DNA_END=968 /DNA_ORIENTATION=+